MGEERLRKEEEERLRLEEEERRREEEETAKKFGLSGFGSFGADPFAHDEEEEDQPGAGGEDVAAEAGGEQQPADTDKEADEGVELIATDDDSHQDSTYGTHQDKKRRGGKSE